MDIKTIKYIVEITAYIVGATWAVWRLWREGFLRPRLEFGIALKDLTPGDGGCLFASFEAHIKNFGGLAFKLHHSVLTVSCGTTVVHETDPILAPYDLRTAICPDLPPGKYDVWLEPGETIRGYATVQVPQPAFYDVTFGAWTKKRVRTVVRIRNRGTKLPVLYGGLVRRTYFLSPTARTDAA